MRSEVEPAAPTATALGGGGEARRPGAVPTIIHHFHLVRCFSWFYVSLDDQNLTLFEKLD